MRKKKTYSGYLSYRLNGVQDHILITSAYWDHIQEMVSDLTDRDDVVISAFGICLDV